MPASNLEHMQICLQIEILTMSLSKRKIEDESDSEEISKKVKVVHQEDGIEFPKEFNLTNFRTKIRSNDFITGKVFCYSK